MTGPSDDKKMERGSDRPPAPPAVDSVNEEVARVFDLLQRLDKLHAGQSQPPPPIAPYSSRPQDSLSSLASLKPDRSHLRAVPSSVPSSYIAPPQMPQQMPPPMPVSQPSVTPPAIPATSSASELPSILSKASAPPQPELSPRKPKTDRPPVMLIASVIIGLAALGGWGLLNLQREGSFAGGPSAPNLTAASTHASLDTTAAFAKDPQLGGLPKSACAVSITAQSRGALSLGVTDPTRKGATASFDVGGRIYKAAFDAAGRLTFKAPLLAESQTVRWDNGSGTACEQTAALPADVPLLRIALVWTGDATLDLHVIEPNAWFGSPAGHISSLQPNIALTQGVGSIETYGLRSDSTNAIVYAVDATRVPPGALINAFVKPATTVTNPSQPVSVDCSSSAAAPPAAEVQYQVHVLRSGPGTPLQSDVHTYAMQVPSCGSPPGDDRAERIMVRN